MAGPKYESSIPANAEEVVELTHDNGARRTAHYYLGHARVGFREWNAQGRLTFEYALRNGEKHGYEYEFYDSGALLEKGSYRRGKLHGAGMQWAEDGRLLVSWKLIDGCGMDLWCDAETGTLAEELFWPAEGELGYRRQWNEDEKTVSEEYHFAPGKGYHGVWRQWNSQGKLRRGFPQFYIADKKVTKAKYLQVRKTDKTLPRFKVTDDKADRKLPVEYLEQRKP